MFPRLLQVLTIIQSEMIETFQIMNELIILVVWKLAQLKVKICQHPRPKGNILDKVWPKWANKDIKIYSSPRFKFELNPLLVDGILNVLSY